MNPLPPPQPGQPYPHPQPYPYPPVVYVPPPAPAANPLDFGESEEEPEERPRRRRRDEPRGGGNRGLIIALVVMVAVGLGVLLWATVFAGRSPGSTKVAESPKQSNEQAGQSVPALQEKVKKEPEQAQGAKSPRQVEKDFVHALSILRLCEQQVLLLLANHDAVLDAEVENQLLPQSVPPELSAAIPDLARLNTATARLKAIRSESVLATGRLFDEYAPLARKLAREMQPPVDPNTDSILAKLKRETDRAELEVVEAKLALSKLGESQLNKYDGQTQRRVLESVELAKRESFFALPLQDRNLVSRTLTTHLWAKETASRAVLSQDWFLEVVKESKSLVDHPVVVSFWAWRVAQVPPAEQEIIRRYVRRAVGGHLNDLTPEVQQVFRRACLTKAFAGSIKIERPDDAAGRRLAEQIADSVSALKGRPR